MRTKSEARAMMTANEALNASKALAEQIRLTRDFLQKITVELDRVSGTVDACVVAINRLEERVRLIEERLS